MRSLRPCILRIWTHPDAGSVVAGTGFLARGVDGRSYALTCAHVVNVVCGREKQASDHPGRIEVSVERLSQPGSRIPAKLERWLRPEKLRADRPSGPSDIAVLSLAVTPEQSWPALRVVPSIRVLSGEQAVPFTTYGFIAPVGNGHPVEGRLSDVDITGRFVAKSSDGHGWFIEPGLSGAPVLAGGAIVGMVSERLGGESGAGLIIPAMMLAQAWPLLAEPYIGLRTFDPETAHLFFGRGRPHDHATEHPGALGALRERIEQQSVVALVGASGSGKSSLVQAGLRPWLEQDGWAVLSFDPGYQPIPRLADAVTEQTCPGLSGHQRLTAAQNWEAALRKDGLARVVDALSPGHCARILIVVDQFERVFNPEIDPSERETVLKMLLRAIDDPRVRLVLTLRLDMQERVVADENAQRMLLDPYPPFTLPRMSGTNIGEAIRDAAALFGVEVDRWLVDNLVADMARNEGHLPLLQEFLRDRWTRIAGDDGGAWRMRRDEADDTGEINLGTVLSTVANDAINAVLRSSFMPGIKESDVLGTLKSMVRLGGPADKPTKRVLSGPVRNASPSKTWKIAVRLAEERIVILDEVGGRPTAELAHEALITHWNGLSTWVAKDREFLIWRDRFEQAFKDWEDRDCRDEDLLKPSDVARAVEWQREGQSDRPAPDDSRVAFIAKSREYRQREQEERARSKALHYAVEVQKATNALFGVDETLEEVCSLIKERLKFDFLAIQFKDKDTQTIQAAHAVGLGEEWYSIARHTYRGDPSLWDIQAHVVGNDPPRIEILSGWDDRFDDFIFRKFGHERLTRVFVPIILARDKPTLGEWRDRHDPPLNALRQTRYDKRTVLELDSREAEHCRLSRSEVIGTIEAGYFDPKRSIDPERAVNLARAASEHAPRLWAASLEHVFEVIAKSAAEMVGAEIASLHFPFEAVRSRHAYEARAGTDLRSTLTPRQDGLGAQALEASRAAGRRVSRIVPDREQGHDRDHMKEFFPEAFKEGVWAQAAIPILTETESALYSSPPPAEPPPARDGLLYVRFTRPHWITPVELEWLEYFADRAGDAIRQASNYASAHDGHRRLVNLHNVARSLANDPTSRQLLDDIAGYVLNLFGASLVTVYEVDAATGSFVGKPGKAGRFRAPGITTGPLHGKSAPRLLVEANETVYQADARRSPILWPPGARDEALGPRFIEREDIASAAGVILRAGRQIVGAMFVNFRTPHFFPSAEQHLMETLASTAAVAIRNRRLLPAAKTKPGKRLPL